MATDAELIARTPRNPDAFAELARRYAGPLHGFFFVETRDAQTAADLTAETLAEALRSVRRFENRCADSAAPWLYGIARNLLARQRRRQQVDDRARRWLGMSATAVAADACDEVVEHAAAEELHARLHEALATLTPAHRVAVELRLVDELPYAEIAARLGCTQSAARIRVSRALRQLHIRLQEVPR